VPAKTDTAEQEAAPLEAPADLAEVEATKPKRRTRKKVETSAIADDAGTADVSAAEAVETTADPTEETAGEPRRGWWQRTFGE